MREFCTGDKCMRVLLAKHFNPTTEPQEFRNLYTEQKLDDAAIARLCCTVCATRGSTFDPVLRVYDPRDAMKYFVALMEKGNTSVKTFCQLGSHLRTQCPPRPGNPCAACERKSP
jgi:hypothetical protein